MTEAAESDHRMTKVLIVTNHMVDLGGSEIVALEVAEYFISTGAHVFVYANYIADPMATVLADSGVLCGQGFPVPDPFSYDLVWAQHHVLPILVTSHELPEFIHTRFISAHLSPFEPLELAGLKFARLIAARFIANSPETAEKLYRLQTDSACISISYNACPDGFFEVPERQPDGLKRLLVISNHPPTEVLQAISILEDRGIICSRIGLGGVQRRVTPADLSWADAVLTIGKSVQYAIASGRPVYCYDHFGGPGWLTNENFEDAEWHNFSGRSKETKRTDLEIVSEIIADYPDAAAAMDDIRRQVGDRYRLRLFLNDLVQDLATNHASVSVKDQRDWSKIRKEADLEVYSSLIIAREYGMHRALEVPEDDIRSQSIIRHIEAFQQIDDLLDKVSEREYDLLESERRLALADAEISALHSSKSWRVTAPLRSIVRIMTRASSPNRWKLMLRPILRRMYQSSSLLRSVWAKYQMARGRFMSQVREGWSREENLMAIRSLTERRFVQAVQSDAVIPAGSRSVESTLPILDLSVVTYNSEKWLRRFFHSLSQQSYPLTRINLFIVDNGSTDNSIIESQDMISELSLKFSSVTIIKQSNVGFGRGHDRAIREGSADYLLVTNVDLEFQPDSIATVIGVAQADASEEFACWELRQVPYEHPKYYDPVTLETNWCSHACVLIRRDHYIKVGGYEPRIFMYGEDVELSYRFRSFGYKLMYVPSAVVRHDTYQSAAEVKPVQWLGSTLGNIYIRARYGSRRARMAGLILYAGLFTLPVPFSGARRGLLKNYVKLLRNWHHFRGGRGTVKAYFPFRAFDYELRRDGAFVQSNVPVREKCPLVSVITRTYEGRETFLAQALASIKNQVYKNIQMIIVQDGGDSLQPLVQKIMSDLTPGREFLFLSNPKLGRSAAGNAGLAAATGAFMMFLDDDDLLFSDHVSTLMDAINDDGDAVAAYGLAMQVETTMCADKRHYVEEGFSTPHVFYQDWDFEVLLDHNYIPIQSVIFSRTLYDQRGGFDVTLDQLEDWHLWLRYGYRNVFKHVPKTTSLFRIPGSENTRLERAEKLHKAYEKVKADALIRLTKIDD